MKRIIPFLLPFMVLAEKTFSQENAIKLYPLSLINKNIRLGYERVITDRSSIQLQTGFQIPGPIPTFFLNDADFDYDIKMHGYNLALDYKVYKENYVLYGGYLSPFIMLNQIKFSYSESNNGIDEEISIIFRYYGLGIVYGKQWVLNNNITLDLFGGLGGIKCVIKGFYETNDPEVDFAVTEADIRNATDISFVTRNLDIEISDNKIKAQTFFIMPTVRFGFSIGYAF